MKCLNCDSTTFTQKKVNIKTEYSDESLEVVVPAHVCQVCAEPLMDSAQMNVLRQAAADQYRDNHDLLNSKKIVGLRKKLNMSQRVFAEYLGVGEASIKRWETYFAQENAMDEHIRLKCDKEFAEKNAFDVAMATQVADEFSGNREFSWDRFTNAVLALIESCKSPLYINKALFYLDFLHFKNHEISITGSSYAKLEYGPCPDDYKVLFKKMLEDGFIKESKGHELVAIQKAKLDIFDDSERETLAEIIKLTKKDSGKKLYNLSHEEDAYTKSSMWNVVSYNYAKKLKIG
jgi:putative zinc finger/helix-turn-helix YgiT family protein